MAIKKYMIFLGLLCCVPWAMMSMEVVEPTSSTIVWPEEHTTNVTLAADATGIFDSLAQKAKTAWYHVRRFFGGRSGPLSGDMYTVYAARDLPKEVFGNTNSRAMNEKELAALSRLTPGQLTTVLNHYIEDVDDHLATQKRQAGKAISDYQGRTSQYHNLAKNLNALLRDHQVTYEQVVDKNTGKLLKEHFVVNKKSS